jgi:hypothetical protein
MWSRFFATFRAAHKLPEIEETAQRFAEVSNALLRGGECPRGYGRPSYDAVMILSVSSMAWLSSAGLTLKTPCRR